MKPTKVTRILSALQELGPMTRVQIADYLDLGNYSLRNAFATPMRPCHKNIFGDIRPIPKRVHIIRWVDEHDGARVYPRPVYALGDGRDAKKPKPKNNNTLCKRRYTARIKVVTSVFDLGETMRTRVKMSGLRLGLRLDPRKDGQPTPPDSGTSCS